MGTSGSKPTWYPGEPDVHAPPCSCSQSRPRQALEGGPDAQKEKGGRKITSLPVVALTDMQFIANGAFCGVYACKYRGWNVVAKRVRQDLPLQERKVALANLWTEYDCLRKLSHPNIIDVYGMCRVRCREGYEDWNEKDVCLLVEQLAFGTVGHLFGTIVPTEKNLASAMARSRKMKMVPFRCRLHRALELAQALEYVHGGSGIGVMMHRDIKSVNVGFAQNGNLKLIDFGLSKMTPPGSKEGDTYKMTGEVGSFRYMAPELVKHEPYNTSVDIYSWAILSWEMLAIDKPYTGINESTFMKKVVIGGDRPELRKSWPERLRKLLASAWDPDHAKRPSAAEIVSVLKIVEADLPARDKRRPSHEASIGGRSTVPGSGRSSGRSTRRHSWTDTASAARPTSLTRLPTGSSTNNGGASAGAGGVAGNNANGTAASPDTKKTASSPSSTPQHHLGPMPPTGSLRLGMSASSNAAAPAKRRWFTVGKKASSGPVLTSGDDGTQPSEAGAASASPAVYVDSAVGGEKVAGRDDGVVNIGGGGFDVDVDGRRRAPEWTTAATASDGGDGPEERRCELHRTLMSLRDIISDALARETEGLPQSGEEEKAVAAGAGAAVSAAHTMPTNEGPKTRAGGAGRAGENGKSGQGSSGGGSTVNDGAKERKEGGEAERPAAAAAAVAEMALMGVHDALDVPSEVRRNASLGKIFGATPSPRHTKDHDPVAAAAAAAEVAVKEAARTQATATSGASSTQDGGTEGVNCGGTRKQ